MGEDGTRDGSGEIRALRSALDRMEMRLAMAESQVAEVSGALAGAGSGGPGDGWDPGVFERGPWLTGEKVLVAGKLLAYEPDLTMRFMVVDVSTVPPSITYSNGPRPDPMPPHQEWVDQFVREFHCTRFG